MSQPGESDREVFSHSMNTIAQFQSAVVVLPPRSELAISSWKAQCWLVLAVYEEDGSRVTRCGHMWCLRRGETTSLLPGVQMESLDQPTIDPASSLFPPSVQVLAVVVPPSSATLVVCRRDQQCTVVHLHPFPAPADTAQGRGKERSIGRWWSEPK